MIQPFLLSVISIAVSVQIRFIKRISFINMDAPEKILGCKAYQYGIKGDAFCMSHLIICKDFIGFANLGSYLTTSLISN
jgi:hypothetical protein